MDDYILGILLEQQGMEQDGAGASVQKKLEERLVLGDQKKESRQMSEEESDYQAFGNRNSASSRMARSGGTAETENNVPAVATDGSRTENGTGAWLDRQRKQVAQKILERIRQPEEIGTLRKIYRSNETGQMEQAGLFWEMSAGVLPEGETGGNARAVFGGTGQKSWQSTMEPERLSMYFQRDARRYS